MTEQMAEVTVPAGRQGEQRSESRSQMAFIDDDDARAFGATMTDEQFIDMAMHFKLLRDACKPQSPLSTSEKMTCAHQVQFCRRAIQAWSEQHPHN